MELITRVNKYLRYSSTEWRDLVLATLTLAFIMSFGTWKGSGFNMGTGLTSFLISSVIVIFSLLVKITAQKIEGLRKGFLSSWTISAYGLLIALILTFLTGGILKVLIPGGLKFDMLKGLRLGKFRYGLNRFELALVAMVGPITHLVLALIFVAFTPASSAPILGQVVRINVWLGIFAMLPYDPMDGYKIFRGSKLTYFFTLGCIIGGGILMYLALAYSISTWVAILGTLLVGGISWFLWLVYVEL